MALKIKAKEQYQNIGKYMGAYRYVMAPELYIALSQSKVIQEAALRLALKNVESNDYLPRTYAALETGKKRARRRL